MFGNSNGCGVAEFQQPPKRNHVIKPAQIASLNHVPDVSLDPNKMNDTKSWMGMLTRGTSISRTPHSTQNSMNHYKEHAPIQSHEESPLDHESNHSTNWRIAIPKSIYFPFFLCQVAAFSQASWPSNATMAIVGMSHVSFEDTEEDEPPETVATGRRRPSGPSAWRVHGALILAQVTWTSGVCYLVIS